MTAAGMTSGPKRKLTFATFGILLLCVYACALVYRYHRNTTYTGEHIKLRREAIQQKNLKLLTGPFSPVAGDLDFKRTDLGKALPIGFADDGTLLYSTTFDPGSNRDKRIFLRRPDGSTKELASRPSGILNDGRVVQQMDNEIRIDGKPLGLSGATNTNLGTEYFGGMSYRDLIAAAGSSFILIESSYVALISSTGVVKEIRSFSPSDESPWIAAGRTFFIFDPIHRNSFPQYFQISASGTVYGVNYEGTQLYKNGFASVRIPYQSAGGHLTPIRLPEGFRPDYPDPLVGFDDSLVVHYRDPHNLQYWPHFLKDGKINPIPLPEGSTSGNAVAVADRSTMVLQCRTTSDGGSLYLMKDAKLFRVPQSQGGADSELRIPGNESGDPRLQGRRWISKTGAFVALEKQNAILFEPRPKPTSP